MTTKENRPGMAEAESRCEHIQPSRYLEHLRSRRAASRRSAPLDCGCRDPWPCRCTQPPLTNHALDSWRDAAEHVLSATGRPPLVPIEVRRAWYRRGGAYRELAERLHEACGGRVA